MVQAPSPFGAFLGVTLHLLQQSHSIRNRRTQYKYLEMTSSTPSFLGLPAEIRMAIYGLCLPSSRYNEYKEYGLFRYILWERGICPKIIYANHQIYGEAMDMLHKQNPFAVWQNKLPQRASDERSFRVVYEQGNRVEHKMTAQQFKHLMSKKGPAQMVRHAFFQRYHFSEQYKDDERLQREMECLNLLRYTPSMDPLATVLEQIPRIEYLCLVLSGSYGASDEDPRSKQYLLDQVLPSKAFIHPEDFVTSPKSCRVNTGLLYRKLDQPIQHHSGHDISQMDRLTALKFAIENSPVF